MARPSLKQQRIENLRKFCSDGAIIRISDAALRLGITEVTIRRDLRDRQTGLICLGGYVMPAVQGSDGYSLAQAASREEPAKIKAAEAAVRMLAPGDTIFIDCGTTTPHLASRLPHGMRLTVVTNALNCTEILSLNPDCNLILLGGSYYPMTGSFVSEAALEQLRQIRISKAFFSAAGVQPDAVSSHHLHEVAIKRAALLQADHAYLVADSSKWNHRAPATFAKLEDFTHWFGRPE